MKEVIIIMMLSLNFIFSQSEELNEALKYYPLHIGDYWQYSIGKSPLGNYDYERIAIGSSEIVGDTVLENGINYFRRKSENMDYYILDPLNVEFVRIDSTTGIVYGNNGIDDEFIVDSLLSMENDIVDYFVINHIESKIVFGIESETKSYSTSWISSYDFYDWDISKGFGLTRTYYGNGTQLDEYERELIYAKIDGQVYGQLVNVKNKNELRKDFKLYQNYPNPFNPKTIISFQVPTKQYIKLKIYDAFGKELKTILEGFKNNGIYSVGFDGTKISSGVYYYVLDYGKSRIVKKMLLLK